MKSVLIIGCMAIMATFLVSCASTLPDRTHIIKSYSLDGIKAYALKLSCDKATYNNVDKQELSEYCKLLESNIKMAMKSENFQIRYDDDAFDMTLDVALEVIDGGSSAARFWIGFGAGRSISTVYVRVHKKGDILAETRITETTTIPNLLSGVSNEAAILNDVPLVAKRIAAFVKDPVAATARPEDRPI